MDTETCNCETQSLANDMSRAFAVSIATTAGMMVGVLTIGFVKERIAARKAKKAKITTEES